MERKESYSVIIGFLIVLAAAFACLIIVQDHVIKRQRHLIERQLKLIEKQSDFIDTLLYK